MKISEVIMELQKIQNSYGDLECMVMSEELNELIEVSTIKESGGSDVGCDAVPLCCYIGT